HFAVDVAQYDRTGPADPRPQQRGDVAGPARQVQHPVAAAHLRGGDEVALPGPVDAQRHQGVHQVVVARDRREHLCHQPLLLPPGDVAEAEVGGVVWPVARSLVHRGIIASSLRLGACRHMAGWSSPTHRSELMDIDQYRAMLDTAIEEAALGLSTGGIPIGAALYHADGSLLGSGHNRRVQEGDPSVHAETDAFRKAGRQASYRDTVMVTTLAPCWYCSGLVRQF